MFQFRHDVYKINGSFFVVERFIDKLTISVYLNDKQLSFIARFK